MFVQTLGGTSTSSSANYWQALKVPADAVHRSGARRSREWAFPGL